MKEIHLKRTMAGMLALCMLALSACSETPVEENSAGAPEADVLPAAETTAKEDADDRMDRASVPDNLPEIDFGGRDFRAAQQTSRTYEFYAEELTGEGTNDAVYNRNLKVEDRFGVKIVSVDYDSLSAITSDVGTLVKSGTDAYEVVSHYAYRAYTPIHAHAYRNWLEVPNVDFSRPWWNSLANEQNTINGILYTATGDVNISSLLTTYAIFFHVPLTEKYGITPESLYSAVYEGTWTIDHFIELTSSIYEDKNGDGRRDDGDVYGFAAWPGISCDAWLPAFDQPITVKDEEGFPVPAINTEKTIAALEKMYHFYYNTEGGYGDVSSAENEVNMFAADGVCFVPSVFDDAFTVYRYMDSAYGILPYPKWTAEQRDFCNTMHAYGTSYVCIPLVAADVDETGAVIEALAYYGRMYITPAYYDVTLLGKVSRDEESTVSLDIIISSIKYDIGYLGGFGISSMLYNMADSYNTDLASQYAKVTKVVNKSLDKMMDKFDGLGN